MLKLSIAAAVVLWGGCFSPSVKGVECGEGGLCPAGQVCNTTLNECVRPGELPNDDPDAGIDANPGDLDSDGVENELDNCPELANPNQHDEDLDEVGDACDNCPATENKDQADVLEEAGRPDGVGDACDPNPTEPGDSIAFFDGFNLAPDPRWSTTIFGDAWSVIDGRLVSMPTGRQAISVDLDIEEGVIRAPGRVVGPLPTNDQTISIGVVAGVSPPGAIFCGDVTVFDNGEADMGLGGLYDIGLVGEQQLMTVPRTPLSVGDERLYEFRFEGATGTCPTEGQNLSAINLFPSPANGGLGLGTINSRASYPYFIVFASDEDD